MRDALTGKVAIVTGASRVIGAAIARRFAAEGARVAIVARSLEPGSGGHLAGSLAEVAEQIALDGGEALPIVADLSDPACDRAGLVARVADELGPVDVLVNNAAGNFPVPAEDLSPNGWRAVTQIVMDGTFFCSREFGRRHIAAKTPGSIVNIGASYAWTGGPGFAHSSAAKAAVKNLTETLAVEWAPYGIRVNCVVPGLFPHEDEAAHIKGVSGRGEGEDLRQPAGRVGQPRELGWAATFLSSPYASYITGATLTVDGANWQRRHMLMPEFRPIREQLGKEPFSG